MRHIETLGSQTGPVFLVYRASQAIEALVARHDRRTARNGFHRAGRRAPQRLGHRRRRSCLRAIEAAFAQVPCFYIADGHHRCAAAVRLYQSRRGRAHRAPGGGATKAPSF